MSRRGSPSSVFCWSNGASKPWSVAPGLAMTPLLHYSITSWEESSSRHPFLLQIFRDSLKKFLNSREKSPTPPPIFPQIFPRLAEEIHRVESAGADWIH